MTRASVISSSRNLPANGARADAYLSPRVIAREAAKLNRDLDLRLSPGRIRQLVNEFVRDGRTDICLRSWLLTYADPTGETACSNVMRELDEP